MYVIVFYPRTPLVFSTLGADELAQMSVFAERAAKRGVSTHIESLFQRHDDGDGRLDRSEVRELVRELFKGLRRPYKLSEEDHATMFALFDRDGGGGLGC